MLKLAQTNQPTDQPTNQQNNRQGKNNMSPTAILNWAINVNSRMFTRKTAIFPSSNVFKRPTPLPGCHFHEDWAIRPRYGYRRGYNVLRYNGMKGGSNVGWGLGLRYNMFKKWGMKGGSNVGWGLGVW
ncbi:hypothetical protein DPMN_015162 [Dreissena polymorpha]|uniref:Uncharacterized protein n=1 Tax=Dreissena polymorpha TaxID=45954 RepID=A0A9D4NB23_DREPO|nr:hypothetical protein DPMN_015162 [Dreissena polymorpha]